MLLSDSKKGKGKFDDMWVEIGKKSFARFYNLSIEEVITMEKNGNGIFIAMMEEILISLNDFENYMVKIKHYDDINEEIPREELLDI